MLPSIPIIPFQMAFVSLKNRKHPSADGTTVSFANWGFTFLLYLFQIVLKFFLGKMSECMEFQDYLQAGVHDSVREGTPAALWAKANMRLTKSVRHLGDSRSQWV